MSYKLEKCNFKEKLIELDIARYIGLVTPKFGRLINLEDADESVTGADLISEDDKAIPIYIQAKVSQGLKTISNVASSKRRNRSKLEDIREYRNDLKLDINEEHFFYFQLRKKAEHALDFQHNILMQYANTGFSHAFYVAPLSINKTEYENIFLDIKNLPMFPFYFDKYHLFDSKWISIFGFIPFLRNHISIIPHERIDTHNHFYAYSVDGTDVTWHSPQFIESKPSRLGDKLIHIYQKLYYSKELENIKSLSNKIKKMSVMKNIDIENHTPLDIIKKHGRILEKEYGIQQLLLIKNN